MYEKVIAYIKKNGEHFTLLFIIGMVADVFYAHQVMKEPNLISKIFLIVFYPFFGGILTLPAMLIVYMLLHKIIKVEENFLYLYGKSIVEKDISVIDNNKKNNKLIWEMTCKISDRVTLALFIWFTILVFQMRF